MEEKNLNSEEKETKIEEVNEKMQEAKATTENQEVLNKKEEAVQEKEKNEISEKAEKFKKDAVEAVKNVESNKKVEKETIKIKEKRKAGIIIAAISLIIAIMIFSTIFALLNINNDKILKGVSILGIDVSTLTAEEATSKINNAIEERFNEENNNLILKKDEAETNVTANTFNAKFDVDSAVAQAYNTGRSGNIITNNYEILFARIFKKDIQPTLYLDEKLLSKTITDINSKMKDAVVESSYYIENKKLIVVRGKAGYIVNQEELKEEIYKEIANIHNNYQIIDIPVTYKEPDPIDLEKIHKEIYKEPKDAYVEKNPTVVHPHVNGVDFGISMKEANKLLSEEKGKYEIPLKITTPKKTIKDLGEEAFPDQLATFSTIYDASSYNRRTNIELAAQKTNGTILMPGETFSFNTVVGSRTLEAGFKEGTAYIGGKVVPDVGGGVCQVSSTIYNAALLANLGIVERSNHMFLTGYVDAGRDATVYYGSLDFVFKNTRKYPIKLVSNTGNGVCRISIYGIKEDKEYEVSIQSRITSYINPTTKYIEDNTLEAGKEVVEQTGITGCRSEAYRTLKLNGKVVSQTLLSKDIYDSREKIVRRGTKKATKVEPKKVTEKAPQENVTQSEENTQTNE